MQSERVWFLKFCGGLLLMAGLCALSGRWGEAINPPYDHCMADPERHAGARLWFPGIGVERPDETGFHIFHKGHDIRVHGTLPPDVKEGSAIGLVANFRERGHLDLLRVHPLRLQKNTRRIMQAASLLATLFVLFVFLRAFRIRWDRLTFRKRGSDG